MRAKRWRLRLQLVCKTWYVKLRNYALVVHQIRFFFLFSERVVRLMNLDLDLVNSDVETIVRAFKARQG